MVDLSARQGAFRRALSVIAEGHPLSDALNAIILEVEAEDPSAYCSILLLDEAAGRLRCGAAPRLPADYNAAIDGVQIGASVGSCGTAAFLNARIIVKDIQTDPLWADFKHLAAAAGLASCWSQPIRSASGRVLGTFAIYHRRRQSPKPADVEFIESAAALAAIVIDLHRQSVALAESEARRQETAAQERESHLQLTTFFDMSLDLLCIRDAQGRFVKLNQAWEQALGYSQEELLGRELVTLIHPDDVERTREVMANIHRDGVVVGFVNRYRRKDGTYRHLEWRARKADEMVFGAARDVTRRLALEAEMDRARQAAEDANDSKSRFLANMSHEIRTPLNGVLGLVDVLGRTPLSPEQAELVAMIQTSGATLERLVSDILDVSKIEAGQLSIERHPFDLKQEMDHLADVARIRAEEKGLSFEVRYGEGVAGSIVADCLRIRQVVENLLSNAVKFTQSGQVRLEVEVTPSVGRDPRPQLWIEVSDTGVGFEGRHADQIFQRFTQADTTITRRFGGSGLGLSICKTLTELMGGAITARSTLGAGSRFQVRLPVEYALRKPTAPVASAPDAEAPTTPFRRSGLRVLLAEDHPVNQKVVQLILTAAGVEVVTVEDGAQAVEAFQRGGFDAVLMDMQMPVMDGLAAIEAIRAMEAAQFPGRRTPIAMLSANAMPKHSAAAYAVGADLHLAKPIRAEVLIAGLAQLLDEAPVPIEPAAAV